MASDALGGNGALPHLRLSIGKCSDDLERSMDAPMRSPAWIFLLSLLTAVAAWAQAPPAVSGPQEFVVTCGAGGAVPFTLRLTAATAPLALRTGDIRPDPAPAGTGSDAVPWTILWSAPEAANRSIAEHRATGMLSACPEPGEYSVPVEVMLGATDPAPQEGVTPPPAGTRSPVVHRLNIKLVRRGEPALQVPATVALAVTIKPFDQGYAWTPELALRLRESSLRADLGPVSVVGGALRNVAGETTEISLDGPGGAVVLRRGEARSVPLTLSTPPAAGTYTASLILQGPALAQERVVETTLRVRVHWTWLVATISLGVGLGWLVNDRLKATADLSQAKLAGLRAARDIAVRASAQRDPAVQQRLLDLAAGLTAKIHAARTVADVTQQVTTQTGQAGALETQAAASSTLLSVDLARVRGLLDVAGQALANPVAKRIAALTAALDRIVRDAAAGDTEAAHARLRGFEQVLAQETAQALHPWLKSVHAALQAFGAWPVTADDPERSRVELQGKVSVAYGLADPKGLVEKSDEIARLLQKLTDLTAPPLMAAAFRSAAATLRGAPTFAPVAEEIEAQIERLAGDDFEVIDPVAALRQLATVRRQVEALLQAAASGNGPVAEQLATGDFAEAAKLVVNPAAARVTASLTSNPPPTDPAALPVPGVPNRPPRLLLPPVLTVGKAEPIRVDPPLSPTLEDWSCTPAGGAKFAASPGGFTVEPIQAGLLTIALAGVSASPVTASFYAGDVTADLSFGKVAAKWDRAAALIGTATGILTVLAGYQIFNASWFGTFGDAFVAFLWGFFGQFGLDRVRQLAAPISARTLS